MSRVGELATEIPGLDPSAAYRLGVVTAVDFRTYGDDGLRKPPMLTIGEGDQERPMRFLGSHTEYNTGQTVMWIQRPGSPLVVGPVPIMGADPADPESLEPWHVIGAAGEPAFQNSWVWFGAPKTVPAFYKQNDGWVRLKGLVKSGTTTATIFTLPAGYRPPFEVYASVTSNNIGGRIRITTAGAVSMTNGGSNVYVQLDGITFPTTWNQSAWKLPRLTNGWSWDPLLSGSTPELFVRDDGWCWTKGAIANGTAPAVWCDLPDEAILRRNGLMFACYTTVFDLAVRIDIGFDGKSFYRGTVTGASPVGNMHWFGGMAAETVVFTAASLLNGWVPQTSPSIQPQAPSYYKDHFGVVHLNGIADGTSKTGDVIFTLPVGYRPLEDHMFLSIGGSDSLGRVDVQADGDVVRLLGTTGSLTLNGASFRAEQ